MDMTSLHNSPLNKIKDIGKKKPQTNSKTMFSFEKCEEKCQRKKIKRKIRRKENVKENIK